jgi:Ion channel
MNFHDDRDNLRPGMRLVADPIARARVARRRKRSPGSHPGMRVSPTWSPTGDVPEKMKLSSSLMFDRMLHDKRFLTGVAVFVPCFFWFVFLVGKRHNVPVGFGVYLAVSLAILILLVVSAARTGSFNLVIVDLIALVALFLWAFSYFYWNYGTKANLSAPLTRLDAVYFALGTLSAAGTGNISAISEKSRAIQTAQMGLGFALVVFAIAAVVARYMSGRTGTPGP